MEKGKKYFKCDLINTRFLRIFLYKSQYLYLKSKGGSLYSLLKRARFIASKALYSFFMLFRVEFTASHSMLYTINFSKITTKLFKTPHQKTHQASATNPYIPLSKSLSLRKYARSLNAVFAAHQCQRHLLTQVESYSEIYVRNEYDLLRFV